MIRFTPFVALVFSAALCSGVLCLLCAQLLRQNPETDRVRDGNERLARAGRSSRAGVADRHWSWWLPSHFALRTSGFNSARTTWWLLIGARTRSHFSHCQGLAARVGAPSPRPKAIFDAGLDARAKWRAHRLRLRNAPRSACLEIEPGRDAQIWGALWLHRYILEVEDWILGMPPRTACAGRPGILRACLVRGGIPRVLSSWRGLLGVQQAYRLGQRAVRAYC